MVKALIVEDSVCFRQSLRDLLVSRFPSMVIEEATDGQEAFKKVGVFVPDLIFMDIKLPGENGLQVTKKLRDQYRDVSIIILTYYDSPEHREAAFEYGATYFLPKGTPSEDIVGVVQSILSGKRPFSHDVGSG